MIERIGGGISAVPAGSDPPHVLNAVIEIAKGGVNKYEYDPETGMFRLERAMLSAVHYPADYGFIPSTRAGDDDPCDVLVLTNQPTFTGCLVQIRPVGLLRMTDEKGDDEKVLAVPTVDPRYDRVTDLGDVPRELLQEIEHFFLVYKQLEHKPVETFGWGSRADAESYVMSVLERPAQQ